MTLNFRSKASEVPAISDVLCAALTRITSLYIILTSLSVLLSS